MTDQPNMRNFTINFGPQHPAAHGVLRPGARVLTRGGDPHRSAYRPAATRHGKADRRHKTYLQAVPYFDRLDYVAPMNQEHAYALAVEKLLGITVPKRAS